MLKMRKRYLQLIYFHVGALGAAMGGIVATTTVAIDAAQLNIIISTIYTCVYMCIKIYGCVCMHEYIHINVPLSI